MKLCKILLTLLAVGVLASAASAETPPSNLTISTVAAVPSLHSMNRAAVAAHWREFYEPTRGISPGWTGNLETCDAGDVAPAYRKAHLQRLNWYRALIGTPGDTVFVRELDAKNQQSALVLVANGKATHYLDPSWKCYTAAADESARNSLLGSERWGTSATVIDQFMYDVGNETWDGGRAVGHRTNLLLDGYFGFGAVYPSDATITNGWAEVDIYAEGSSALIGEPHRVRERRYVAYPTPGFSPDTIFLQQADGSLPVAWNFVMGADFTNAVVVMSDGNTTWQPRVLARYRDPYFGDAGYNYLVWEGVGVRDNRSYDTPVLPLGPGNDRKWTVTISGIMYEGVPRTITYPVYAFNPRDTTPNPVRGIGPVVVEYYHAGLDHYFITADPSEQAFVDSGGAGTWVRTGSTFKAGGTNPVCRFYGNRSKTHNGPNSHFYTANYEECDFVKQDEGWWLESFEAFWTTPATGGTCPSGTVPIYRAYNDGFARGVDSNHRITPNHAEYQATVARGWKGEGVVMCGGV